jgi:2-keto-4-pentenoate hydratase/2-oxohepta-3-ene-1,7-dioic acid hydratase in catechol pathway
MRLASYTLPECHKKSYGIVTDDGIIDIGQYIEKKHPDLKSVLQDGGLDEIKKLTDRNIDFEANSVQFLPVISNPGKIFCVGMNYAEKRKEFNEQTDAPTLFIRFADSLTGHERPVLKPQLTNEFDYEGELAVIIGKQASKVKKANALSYVAGYSCFMDGSVRDMQYSWFTSGKNWEKTGAFGPCMVTTDEINDPQNLLLQTYLNGKMVQSDSTANMIRSVAELIEYISAFSPLSPGDIIITGSPGGVGKKRTPPLFMHSGDRIEVEISGIGKLSNTVATIATPS